MGVNGEALQLPAVYTRPYFYKFRENPYQVLQVTCAASEHAMKSKVRIIKSFINIGPSYCEKYHSFVAIGIVTCAVHS